MSPTVFLGVASVLNAIGAFLASRQHFYSAYTLFVGAVVMAILAVFVQYRTDYRRKRGREELGRVLVQLSQCELAAYDGNNGGEYHRLKTQLEQIKSRIGEIAKKHFDSSIESRFLAVNVLDVDINEAARDHFRNRVQMDFFTMYQQIKGWRMFLHDLLRELMSRG